MSPAAPCPHYQRMLTRWQERPRKKMETDISKERMQRHNEGEIIHHSQGHLAKILQIEQPTYLVTDDPPLKT